MSRAGMSSLPEVDDGEEGDAADSGPPLTPHSGLSKLDGLDGSRRPLGASPEAGTPPPSTPPGGPHYADAVRRAEPFSYTPFYEH